VRPHGLAFARLQPADLRPSAWWAGLAVALAGVPAQSADPDASPATHPVAQAWRGGVAMRP